MVKCVDCNLESQESKGWYADFTETGKKMRCPSCGEQEKERRWINRYGIRPLPKSFDDVDKQDRIQYAKDLRESNIGPWQYRQEQKDNKGQEYEITGSN